ncbi:RagB/SusD family nutrient uptake outer membrane protein [Mariniflexile sp.]|uniref:RagB/SusD family nutrient uptake outer membrane protein n=1 Tax=Mariniflexile sp. TaxID=1979402 RepID=UPI004048A6E2
MKKINHIPLLILGIVLLNSSCSDFLDENREDRATESTIYLTPGGLESGIVGLYNLQRDSRWVQQKSGLFLYTSHDLALVRTFNDQQVYGTEYNPLLFPATHWVENYKLISNASAFIQSAPNVEMPSEKRNIIIGQAKYIRAQSYLDLIRLYGNILLDTTVTTYENLNDPKEYKPANPADIYKLIDSDLDFAIANLKWNVAPGRAGQGAARMLRANSAMWQQDWKEAADQCDAIIESGTYSLVPIDKVFAQDVNHKEAIYTMQYDLESGGSARRAGGPPHAMAAYFTNRYYEASSEMVEDVALGGQTYSWTVPNDYLRSLYDPAKDKRLDYYFWRQTYDKSYIVNNPLSPNFGQPLDPRRYPDNFRQFHWSLKKYFDLEKPVATGLGYKDVIIYRLAETYLLGAEAHWRNTNNPTNPKALEYMRKVRERAGLLNVTSIDQQTILDEGARELCFEGLRWFTLKRMGVLVQQVNANLKFGSNSRNVVPRTMQPYMVDLPIPQSQIDFMKTFPQNPGYEN